MTTKTKQAATQSQGDTTTAPPVRTFAASETYQVLSSFGIEPPDWFPAKVISQLIPFSRSSLYELAAEGKIRSANFRKKGQRKARRLFSYSDLLRYVKEHASGGMEPAEQETAA